MDAPGIEIFPLETLICQNCAGEFMARIAFIHEEDGKVFFKWASPALQCPDCNMVVLTEDQETAKNEVAFSFDCDHCGCANFSRHCHFPKKVSCCSCFNEYNITLSHYTAKYYAAQNKAHFVKLED
jgi:hypothetical protein